MAAALLPSALCCPLPSPPSREWPTGDSFLSPGAAWLTMLEGPPRTHPTKPRHRPSARAGLGPDEPVDALGWASTPTRCGEITAHRLPPLAVACRV